MPVTKCGNSSSIAYLGQRRVSMSALEMAPLGVKSSTETGVSLGVTEIGSSQFGVSVIIERPWLGPSLLCIQNFAGDPVLLGGAAISH